MRINPLHVLIVSSLVFTSLAVIGGEVYDLYERLPWYDVMLHFKSGWGMSLVASYLVLRYTEIRNPTGVALIAMSCSMHLGVQWEIFEYMADSTLGLNMQKSGLDDTMTDMIADSVGAALGAVTAYRLCSGHNSGAFLKALKRLIGE